MEDVLVSLPSRQLRAPLATMVGVAELIASSDMTSEQCRAYALDPGAGGRRLTAMVKSALELAGPRGRRRANSIALSPTSRSLIHRAVKRGGRRCRTADLG